MRKKTGTILILKTCRLGIAFLNLYLSARYFGVSIERDSWLLAMNVFIVFDMAIWGPINETFRAKFVFLKAELGEAVALAKSRSLLLFSNGITMALVAIVLWKPELISGLIAPSYKGEQLVFLIFMIRILAPSFLFNQITQLFIGILNAYHSIYIPELAGFLSGIINLVLIIVLAPQIGIISLVYAYYIGLVLLLIALLIQLNVKKISLFSHLEAIKLADAKPFILFALPFFLPYFIGQIALVIEKSISSSLGTGIVSILDYSRKFTDITLNVLMGVLFTIFVPLLSTHFIKKDIKAFLLDLRQIYQLGFLLITFVITLLTVCPHALISMIYRNDNISALALQQMSSLTRYYGWAILPIFLYYIFGVALLSSKREKYFALYGSLAQLIMIVLNFLLYKRLNMYVFPLSLLIAHLIAACFMWLKLPYGKRELIRIALKYLAVAVGVLLMMYLLNRYFVLFESAFLVLFVNAIVLLLVLLGSLFLFKLDERLSLIQAFEKLVKQD